MNYKFNVIYEFIIDEIYEFGMKFDLKFNLMWFMIYNL